MFKNKTYMSTTIEKELAFLILLQNRDNFASDGCCVCYDDFLILGHMLICQPTAVYFENNFVWFVDDGIQILRCPTLRPSQNVRLSPRLLGCIQWVHSDDLVGVI